MLRHVTQRNSLQHMPSLIHGVTYYTSQEVLAAIGVSRQTLWRWRQEPDFPQGARLRGRLLFSEQDVAVIQDLAFQLEPVRANRDPSQLPLFAGAARG